MVEDKAGEAAIGDATVDGGDGVDEDHYAANLEDSGLFEYHPILGCRGEGRRLDGCEFPLWFFPIKIV